MKGLLDTHTFMEWDGRSAQLSATARVFILDQSNTVLLSVASIWEIVMKVGLGKLALSRPLDAIIREQEADGIQVLPIQLPHVLAVASLPAIHRDPFDRLLIAQANVEQASIITTDPLIARYPTRVVWQLRRSVVHASIPRSYSTVLSISSPSRTE